MLDLVIEARKASIAPGMDVKRILPFRQRRMVGPFIFMDHAGPVNAAPPAKNLDVLPHPHIGLSTVSYLFGGQVTHRDSLGVKQVIRPGEVNWMTAGSGITHSERFERARLEGGSLDGIQAWVALPDDSEECPPSFHHVDRAGLSAFAEGGVEGRLVAGAAFGLTSAVPVHSPLFYVHWTLAAGTRTTMPEGYLERAAYVASGSVEVDGVRLAPGQMAVFRAGTSPVITALAPTVIIALGGEPVGPRFIDWNFVSSRRERIEQAKADWRAGRMKLPDHDADEFIPLPPEPGAPPNPMS